MPRTLSEAAIEASRDPHLDVAVLQLLIITHPDLDKPVRVVNNTEDLDWLDPTTGRTDSFTGWPFALELPDEGDRPPQGTLTIQNVDRRIGQAVRELRTPPRMRIVIIADSDHSDIWLDYDFLWFTQVTGNAQTVSGQIGSQQQSARAWPRGRLTQREFPAMFR